MQPSLSFLGVPLEAWTSVTNVVLTIALAYFARMQWKVTADTESARRAERTADENARQQEKVDAADRAYQFGHAEYYRLLSLHKSWSKDDVVLLSALGTLRPDYVIPGDATKFLDAFTHLSLEAGFLAASALSMANDVGRGVAMMNSTVDEFRKKGQSVRELADLVRHNRPTVNESSLQIMEGLTQVTLLMKDALLHAPHMHGSRELNFQVGLESELGRKVVMKGQEKKAAIGNGKGHANAS